MAEIQMQCLLVNTKYISVRNVWLWVVAQMLLGCYIKHDICIIFFSIYKFQNMSLRVLDKGLYIRIIIVQI